MMYVCTCTVLVVHVLYGLIAVCMFYSPHEAMLPTTSTMLELEIEKLKVQLILYSTCSDNDYTVEAVVIMYIMCIPCYVLHVSV